MALQAYTVTTTVLAAQPVDRLREGCCVQQQDLAHVKVTVRLAGDPRCSIYLKRAILPMVTKLVCLKGEKLQ